MKKDTISNLIILLLIIVFAHLIFYNNNQNGILPYDDQLNELESVKDSYSNEITERNSNYYYQQLNDTQQDIYTLLEKECMKYHSTIKLNKVSSKDMAVATYALSMDYPEFFWTDQYTYKTLNSDYVVEIKYEVPSNIENIIDSIDTVVKQIFEEMNENNIKSDYDKLKFFYDWIVNHTDYGDVENSQNIRSVFLENTSVCAGYSRAFQYLCKLENIECTYVAGYTRSNEKHGWNLVKLNGEYYWVDVTWGDPVFAGEQDNKINYNYFLVDDNELLKNHVIENRIKVLSNNNITQEFSYPSCVDDSLNYYQIQRSLFKEYNQQTISQFLKDKLYNGIYKDIELKFENEKDYNTFLYQFITKENALIYDIIKETNPFFYGTMLVRYETIESANYVKVSIELK